MISKLKNDTDRTMYVWFTKVKLNKEISVVCCRK